MAYPLFGPYFFSPNKHMFAFGGDALTLYYNVAYHTCYGSGDHLTSMNYPNGELIFLTDAQGALSVLLSFINRHMFDVCDYSIGIIHSLMMVSYLASIFILYHIFINLGIVNWRAASYAALTAVMAPQVQRMVGHHGLSYSFLIPLAILWLMRKYNVRKAEKRDFLLFIVLLFFGFNNPYIGFATCLFMASSVAVYLYFNRKHIKGSLLALGFSLLPIIIIFLYIKINDPFHDRLKQQWGFFNLKSTFEGLLAPPGSLFDKLLHAIVGKGFGMEFESIANLGFPIAFTLLAFGGLKIFKPKVIESFSISTPVKYMLIATSIVFLYTSAIIFMPFTKNFVEDTLGFLLMFKAVARLSWPFWYILVFVALVLIEQLLGKVSRSGYLYTIVLVLSLWYVDYAIFRKPGFLDTAHSNLFSKNDNQYMLNVLKEKNVDPNNYQAILLLPKLMLWTDHFSSETNFFTQFFGMRLSRATGLPIISAMLSRMSIGETAEKIEFIGDPLIEKSLHKLFPNQKNILVVVGKGNPALKKGEQYLLSISKLLIDQQDYAIYELPLANVNKYSLLDSLKRDLVVGDTIAADAFKYESFDDLTKDKGYFSSGAFACEEGETLISQYTIENPIDSVYEFSAWTKIGLKKYGLGNWKIAIADSTGHVFFEQFPVNATSNEVHDDWVRAETLVRSCKKCNYKFIFCASNESVVDEILFRPQSFNILNKEKSSYNGFKYIK